MLKVLNGTINANKDCFCAVIVQRHLVIMVSCCFMLMLAVKTISLITI